jgi:hypothetical protein
LIELPEWTEQLQKRGLDPLGMQNAGVALYQQLLPGISNVTLRIRYYGLYCWLSDAYARLSGSTDPDEWRRWVRRCEAVYALAASHANNEAGVAGVEWVLVQCRARLAAWIAFYTRRYGAPHRRWGRSSWRRVYSGCRIRPGRRSARICHAAGRVSRASTTARSSRASCMS